MKVTFCALAVVAALFAALVLGWEPASAASCKRATTIAVTSARGSGHAATRAAHHVSAHHASTHHASTRAHDPWTSIDDDDEYDDDDVVESGMMAPDRREIDQDASAREPAVASIHAVPATVVCSMHLRRRAIRPSREHRDTTDRPPRA